MHKFYTASFDASIYLQLPKQNTGLDGILEVGKFYTGTTKEIYRTLIKFPTSDISSSLSSGEITGNWKAFLNLKSAYSTELPINYTLYVNAVSQSWTMGIGKKYDYITTQGVSWQYRDGLTEWSSSGANWYATTVASQSFNYSTDDIRMDVTDIINLWINGSIINDGFILRHGAAAENDSLNYGYSKFFSKETDTIYQPKLEIVWNDSVINTGSLSPVTGSAEDDYKVIFTNLKTKYPKNTKIQIRIKGRDSFPLKSFGTTFAYDQSKYLPITTYYQLEDYVTSEIICPFGEYTKISCDSRGNYFNIDLATLPIGRTYKLKIKIVENGISTIIDQKSIFEIEY
jgi:hypothetical protein